MLSAGLGRFSAGAAVAAYGSAVVSQAEAGIRRVAVTGVQTCALQISSRRRHTRLQDVTGDRKSTRLNSSHGYISYAVFCLKKKERKEDSLIVANLCSVPLRVLRAVTGTGLRKARRPMESIASILMLPLFFLSAWFVGVMLH